MQERLLDFVVCPACKSSLSLAVSRHENGDIQEGALTCQQCGQRYPIQKSVPRFLVHLSDVTTAESFGFEWTTVEVTDYEEDVVTFFRKTGLDETIYEGLPVKETMYPSLRDIERAPNGSALSGKLVLDVGCGMGRYLNVAKEYGCEVVGMDFSRSVERASKLLAGNANVHIIQGDIFTPPFKEGLFDYIYSIGVIHHTPNPPAAFRSLASLCRSGGWVSVYVYPPSFWLDPMRGAITKCLRLVTVRLPHPILLQLCQHVALPLGRLQRRLAAHPVTKALGAPLFLITVPRHHKHGVMVGDTFDTYSAKYIWTYTPAEVGRWFHAAGFDQVHAPPYPTTVRGRKRRHDS